MKAITPESAKKNTDKAISSTSENEKQSLTDDLSVIEARAEASVGNKKDSDFDQDESLLKTGSLKSSVYSADSKLSASSNGSRVSKPRPLDPLSMYLEKSKKKRSKR
ncbi:hypothetical protein BATDEDRAFT_28108 [Batrachochytrium dendrobatidis JAM81]|uniref:Uncharacterized protein n=1 Tax=Batrachochytrium dendrobatidis (strain JAM81 / FGSC 10211) TaxID=684364 RepID=F4PCV1_BATDJ|nr:uncharacterized protein BATDEDRAFT_28108 [Batrachochytrium dendrobatidis JAM81]EGF77007.1 hypothetical protein BATDEDRAFT_28108 [Batrachochytrium dendrobatidis JAM81]|eukprot:XP_006682407.1 hypothetical protein BATDEDRAFT_28108 [Batrachochytrium dendrobatidis JAM81]